MAEKKKNKRSYLNDFRVNLAGDYVYEGALYRYTGPQPREKAMRALVLRAALMAAAVIAAGCVKAPGMLNCFYVILPYIGEVAAAAFAAWQTGRLLAGGEPMRGYVYEASVKKLGQTLSAVRVMAVLALCTNVLYDVLNAFGGRVLNSLLVIALTGLTLGAGEMLRRVFETLSWESSQLQK